MTDTDWGVLTPDTTHAPAIERVIRGCDLFDPVEADGFAGMLPELLADPGNRWRVLTRGDETVGAAYLSRDGMSEDVRNLWFIGLVAPAQGQGGGTRLLRASEGAVRDEGGRMLLVETSSGEALADTRAFYAARS